MNLTVENLNCFQNVAPKKCIAIIQELIISLEHIPQVYQNQIYIQPSQKWNPTIGF